MVREMGKEECEYWHLLGALCVSSLLLHSDDNNIGIFFSFHNKKNKINKSRRRRRNALTIREKKKSVIKHESAGFKYR